MTAPVLVTGGTGYVASWVIAELLQSGHPVRTTVRDLAKAPAVRAAVGRAVPTGALDRLAFAAADLTRDEGWSDAVAGCSHVLHVASPLGGVGRDPDSFLAPARDGTLRVLRAATAAGIERVVMTSAAAAARPPRGSQAIADETMWTDTTEHTYDPYRRSKILAERAAWDFMAEAPSTTSLTTVLPGAVFGPVLSKDALGSARVIQGLLRGKPGGLPRFGFSVVDVRDLAALQVRAMTAPAAANQRFLATGEFVWMAQIAQLLRQELGARAAKVPTRRLPDLVVKAIALVAPSLRMLAADVGRQNASSSDKARRLLGFSPRPLAATLVDCAESLAAVGA